MRIGKRKHVAIKWIVLNIHAHYPKKWSHIIRFFNLFPFIVRQEKIIHLAASKDTLRNASPAIR